MCYTTHMDIESASGNTPPDLPLADAIAEYITSLEVERGRSAFYRPQLSAVSVSV